MNNLPEYLKELSEKTQKLQPFSNSLTQQLHQYTKLNNSLNFGITHYLNDSLKNSINENNLYNVNRAISQIHKTSSFQLPENALASISRISERQYDLTSAWANSLRDMPNLSSELYRITNLNDSISNISAQIAKISEISKNWSTFYEYENITSQALLFSENLTNTEEFNEEETSNKFKELIGLFKKFYNKNKKAGAKAFLVLEIILLIPSFHQYYDFLKESQN